MSPMLESGSVDWLPNLFSAWGSNTALGLVEFDTGIFKWQAAEVENSRNLYFEIAYDILVFHTQYKTGKDLVLVLHELDVLSVVVANIRQVGSGRIEILRHVSREDDKLGNGTRPDKDL
jgi:hypothetical protein